MILVDTHIVVWLAFAPEQLTASAGRAVAEARSSDGGVAISDITLLELANLASKGRIQLNTSLESFLQEVEARFIVLPITARICARMLQLPAEYPKDPADRIIGATAQVHGLPLVTADQAIRRSKAVQTIWE